MLWHMVMVIAEAEVCSGKQIGGAEMERGGER